ncbi:MAG: septum formation protein Maf [Agathobacter sp.]|nr:septum formation protein Maf [Agathobacter sp.]
MSSIILASSSPRRKELLEQIGLEFEICPAKGEEVITKKEPQDVVMELSKQKAEEVAAMVQIFNETHEDITTATDIMVIGADTVVAHEGVILGKPKDEGDARRMLSALSGNTHSVFTGVTICIIAKDGRVGEICFYEKTDVTMFPITDVEMDRYLAMDEYKDKAGSYAIQGKSAIFIEKIDGDYNNVVGLPITRIYQKLKEVGIDLYLW